MIVVDAKYLGKAERISDANGRYIEFCKSSLKRDINFSSLKIVLDVANGAAYDVAPKVFRELGAELIVIADKPDGMNINKDCGSTNIELLKNEVKKHAADFGLALDGDGDRLIFVDENSEKLDGDEILFILARDKFENQITLGSKGVVGTIMTNKGLEIALKEFGIDLIRADVGDRYVLQKLEELEWELGGEQSGHIMCLDIANTGDAIVSSIKFLEAVLYSNKSLQQLLKPFKKYPQILTKIKTSDPDKILSNNEFVSLYENFLEKIKLKDGRINIRKSGTESAIRIMVESTDENHTKDISDQLTKAAQQIA
jgi:phosphoglucosamine mutase